MNHEVYIAASGMRLEQRWLEQISQNLANVSTAAYRPQRLLAASHDGRALRWPAVAVALGGAYTVPGTGPLRETGRPWDVALPEGRYLLVRTAGGIRLTRAGALQLSAEGRLTDALGHPVLDQERRPIEGLTPQGRLAGDGRVLDGEVERARLAVVHVEDDALQREGDGLWDLSEGRSLPQPEAQPELRVGWLEGSATRALDELVRLIEAQRAFEGYQKVLSVVINDVNRSAVRDLAG